MPTGGAFDRESATLANVLCKRAAEAPLLEVSVSEVILSVSNRVEGVSFSVVGAGHGYRSVLRSGTELRLAPRFGERIYIAWCGLMIDPELESRQIFGTQRFLASSETVSSAKLADPPLSLFRERIRFLPGPHFELLGSPSQLEVEIGNDRSRIGIRANAGLAPHNLELPSEPCQVGTIQVTPLGELLIIGPDGPTTGGYPKLGYVFEADIDKLGQLTIGDRPIFLSAAIDEATQSWLSSRLSLSKKLEILLIL